MLDHIASASEAQFKRQVQPTAEGHLRPESRQGHESQQANHIKQKLADRAELQKTAEQRRERLLKAGETSRRRSESLQLDLQPTQSKAEVMAEKLARSVRESRQEQAKQERSHRFSPANRSRQLNQAYVTNLPIQHNRLVDEMV